MTADASDTRTAKSWRTLWPTLPKRGMSGTAASGVAQTSQSNGIVVSG